MTEQTSTELVRVEDWLELMPELEQLTSNDSEGVALEIVKRILQSPSFDEALTPQELPGARDLLGVPLELRGVRWQRSTFNGGPQVYAVIDAIRLDTGEYLSLTCGGRNVIAQLLVGQRTNDLAGKQVAFRESNPTPDGYRALWMVGVTP